MSNLHLESIEKTVKVYERLFRDGSKTLCDDTQSTVERMNFLKKKLMNFIVEDIMFRLYQEVEKHCDGCKINHPSQLKHSCLMTTQEEWIELYFEDVIDRVNFENIFLQWYPIINIMHLKQWESERAYVMWNNIKEEFAMMVRHPDPGWKAEWYQRVYKRTSAHKWYELSYK